jgi:hypothetical protein
MQKENGEMGETCPKGTLKLANILVATDLF